MPKIMLILDVVRITPLLIVKLLMVKFIPVKHMVLPARIGLSYISGIHYRDTAVHDEDIDSNSTGKINR